MFYRHGSYKRGDGFGKAGGGACMGLFLGRIFDLGHFASYTPSGRWIWTRLFGVANDGFGIVLST